MFCPVGRGVRKRNLWFCLKPSFWRRPPASLIIRDQEQAVEVVDGGDGLTNVKCEPVPAELASKNVIM